MPCVFVDPAAVMAAVAATIPTGAHVVDIGGGDGVMLNALLETRPDLTATMTDIRDDIGASLSETVRPRVTLLRSTPAGECPDLGDAVLIADVLHHVPPAQRAGLLADALRLLNEGGQLIVKDVEPKGFIAWLGYLADRYISGDRQVQLIGVGEVRALLGMQGDEILGRAHHPNYALVFHSR